MDYDISPLSRFSFYQWITIFPTLEILILLPVDYDIFSPLEILLLLPLDYDISLLSRFSFFYQWITIFLYYRDPPPSTIGLLYSPFYHWITILPTLEILVLLPVDYDISLPSRPSFFYQWITICLHSRDPPSTSGLRYFSTFVILILLPVDCDISPLSRYSYFYQWITSVSKNCVVF